MRSFLPAPHCTQVPMSVWFILTPPVLMLDYTGPAEAFRMAEQSGAGFVVHHCACMPSLKTSLGPELTGFLPLPDRLPENSLVILTGTSGDVGELTGEQAQKVVQWLRTVPGPTTTLASICSGALLLAQAGLLANRRCTTHHTLIDALRASAPSATVQDDCLFVDDGRVLTSAGVTAGIDLALHLIERHAGAELASRIARRQVVYQRRAGNDVQLSAWLDHRNHMHPAVHRAQDAIALDPSRTWSVAQLAAHVHVSTRHLSRLFAEHAKTTVSDYQQGLRIARARELLTQSQMSIDAVAEHAGFTSTRDFRRVWRRYESTTPMVFKNRRTPDDR